jgi:hypothetical protein
VSKDRASKSEKKRVRNEAKETKNQATKAKMKWPAIASIVYPLRGELKLTDQNHDLQAVIRGGMDVVLTRTLFECAFPVIDSRLNYVRSALLTAARTLGKKEIKERLKKDDDFVEAMVDLV